MIRSNVQLRCLRQLPGNPEASQLKKIGFPSFTVRFCAKVVNWTGTKQKSKMKLNSLSLQVSSPYASLGTGHYLSPGGQRRI